MKINFWLRSAGEALGKALPQRMLYNSAFVFTVNWFLRSSPRGLIVTKLMSHQ